MDEATQSADGITRRATISADNRYRYRLTRSWSPERPMIFVMLNPSTADDRVDDPTIRRCIGFAKRESCGGIIVVNLYALRSTDPRGLHNVDDPYGPKNAEALQAAIDESILRDNPIVCAWGTKGRDGIERFLGAARRQKAHLHALGITADGYPKHPLYIAANAPLITYRDFREPPHA